MGDRTLVHSVGWIGRARIDCLGHCSVFGHASVTNVMGRCIHAGVGAGVSADAAAQWLSQLRDDPVI